MNLSSYLQMPPAPPASQTSTTTAPTGALAGVGPVPGNSLGLDFAKIMARQFERMPQAQRQVFAAPATATDSTSTTRVPRRIRGVISPCAAPDPPLARRRSPTRASSSVLTRAWPGPCRDIRRWCNSHDAARRRGTCASSGPHAVSHILCMGRRGNSTAETAWLRQDHHRLAACRQDKGAAPVAAAAPLWCA